MKNSTKKQFILFCIALIAAAPICFAQASPSKSEKSASKESTIIELEKSVTEAYKNKQADAFKKYLAADYAGVNAEGITTADIEVEQMQKDDLRDYSFADTKVVFPSADVAVITYKVTVQASSAGQDTSGTYNSGTVWMKHGGKWHAVLHTFVKAQ